MVNTGWRTSSGIKQVVGSHNARVHMYVCMRARACACVRICVCVYTNVPFKVKEHIQQVSDLIGGIDGQREVFGIILRVMSGICSRCFIVAESVATSILTMTTAMMTLLLLLLLLLGSERGRGEKLGF